MCIKKRIIKLTMKGIICSLPLSSIAFGDSYSFQLFNFTGQDITPSCSSSTVIKAMGTSGTPGGITPASFSCGSEVNGLTLTFSTTTTDGTSSTTTDYCSIALSSMSSGCTIINSTFSCSGNNITYAITTTAYNSVCLIYISPLSIYSSNS